jgi:hypothetical protein
MICGAVLKKSGRIMDGMQIEGDPGRLICSMTLMKCMVP